MSENQNGFDLMFNAGTALSILRDVDGNPYVVVPDGFQVHDLLHMRSEPVRNKGNALLNDADSFVAFVLRHKLDNSDLYYSVEPPVFTAVFNGARPDAPAWQDHRAVYRCPLSHQWSAWTKNSGQRMTQEEFALFVESNLPDIVAPDSADMLEIVLTLQAKKKVNFASGLRLSNGSNELTYEEQVEGSAAKGKLQIPEEITLGIPVFENGDSYAVTAKFRYRITEGRLSMWYELVRPHLIIQDAVRETRERIERDTGLIAINGSPEQ